MPAPAPCAPPSPDPTASTRCRCLQPGVYDVRATLEGFRVGQHEGVRVTVTETARVAFDMEVGQVSETVTVTATATLVETSNATRGIVIDQQKVVDLPLNGRNFTQLGTLIPGVVAPPTGLGGQNGDATPGGFGNATGGFNVNGMRNQSNNFLMDGATNNDTFNTGFVLRPPPDAIEEFKIHSTHAFGAEFGRNAGSVVNVVTKSGSEQARRGGLGVQPRRRAAGPQLLRPRQPAQAGTQAEPVRRRLRRAGREEQAVRLRLLRGLPQRRGHHHQRAGALGSAAHRQLRYDHDPRSADRRSFPRATPSWPTASAQWPRSC